MSSKNKNKNTISCNNNSPHRSSTIKGMALSQAKQMASIVFGNNLAQVIHNTQNNTFDIYIFKSADEKEIEKFKGKDHFRLFYRNDILITQ